MKNHEIIRPERYLETACRFPEIFRPRDALSHKGTYGTLAVIGGAQGMSGAVVLAAAAAMYAGCGKVWAGFNQPQLPFPVIPERPEIMLSTADALLGREDLSACVAGCGLGLTDESAAVVLAALNGNRKLPLLLDADALTLLARLPEAAEAAKHYSGSLVLTPHPAEAARLLGVSVADIQTAREDAVREISRKYRAVTVLKGHASLVCGSDGNCFANRSGNAGLATAGSGDVLSGIAGSFLAQGFDAFEAVCAAVWLHGAAADLLRDNGIGESGLLAGEIAPAARFLRNFLSKALSGHVFHRDGTSKP